MKMNWAQLIVFDVWIKCQTYKIRVERRGTFKGLCLNWLPPAGWGFEFCYVTFELLFVSKYLSGVPVN